MTEKLVTIYKITDVNGKTRPGQSNETQWGVGVTHTVSGEGELCGPGWLHGYHHPLLAVLLNPAHGNYDATTMRLWCCKAVVGIRNADKLGCTKITTVEEIPLPVINTTQRVAFALIVAKRVYKNADFKTFADNWLSGKDRSVRAAAWAARAAWAVDAAAEAAADAADAAAAAAAAAADAARVQTVAVAWAVAWAAWAAAWAAWRA